MAYTTISQTAFCTSSLFKPLQTMYHYCCPNHTHSDPASQLYFLFTHLKSAITGFVSFTVPQRDGSSKKTSERGCTGLLIISCFIPMPLRTWLCLQVLCLKAHVFAMLLKQSRWGAVWWSWRPLMPFWKSNNQRTLLKRTWCQGFS